MFRQVLFGAENQGNHQNFKKSLLTNKLWHVFTGRKKKKKKKNLKKNQNNQKKCYPIKTRRSLLVSKDFSKF